MEEKIKKPKAADVSKDAVKEYFTKDLLGNVDSMTSDEMISLLKELESTRYWIAIVKYSHQRLTSAQQALITLDPFKEPTAMARYQGVMSGISDLQEAVISLKKKSEDAVNPEKKAEKEKEDLGGAYGAY